MGGFAFCNVHCDRIGLQKITAEAWLRRPFSKGSDCISNNKAEGTRPGPLTDTGEYAMKNPRIVVALLAASALGLTASAVAQAEDVPGGDASQEAAATTETDRQQRRADRSERREQRQRRAARDGDSNTAQKRRADRSGRYAGRNDGDVERTHYRRSERRQSEDRQTRHDRRQNWSDRGEAGRHARWRDQRDHREFNRRDFGHARSERRRVAHGERRHGGRFPTKHQAFDRRVDRRLDKQRARTRAGWKKGEVTYRELKRIRKDQRKIARMDRRFGSDGRYTKRERRKLNNALDRASNRVYRAKHNDRVARNGQARRHRR